METLVRLILAVALIATVWRHSHWSVALTLTLMVVRTEVEDILKERAKKAAAELQARIMALK